MASAVRFETIAEGQYCARVDDLGVAFHVDYLRRERHELIGELKVTSSLAGSRAVCDGTLTWASFNFSSASARQQRAKLLGERARTSGKVDWLSVLEEVCHHVLTAERMGQPALILADVPAPHDGDDDFDVDGFRFSAHHPTIIFGDGGTAKSYHALRDAGELTRRGIATGYCDWELDAREHRRRLERLFGQDMPAVRYIRVDRPLVFEVDRLRRLIREHGLRYLMLDSIAFGVDGPPESAESAMAYMRAVRQLGIGARLIAHVTKSQQSDSSEQRPFGSVFWHNSARATWFAKLGEASPDGRTLTVGLHNRKNNLGPLAPPTAYLVNFANGKTEFGTIDPRDVDSIAGDLPLWHRIRAELSSGPLTLARLADALEVKVDSVEKAVKRRSNVFTFVRSEDGIRRVGLLERRAS